MQGPVDVSPDDGAYRVVVEAVPDEPAADVREVLGRVLHPVDVGDGLEGGPPGGVQAEQVGEGPVQLDVVAVQGVRPERYMVEAD